MNTPTSRTHVIVGAALAAAQVLNGGAALGDVIGPKAFGLLALLVAAFQAFWQYFTAATTTPNANVAAVDIDGTVVAGPAGAPHNGVAVELIPTTPGD